MGSGRANLRRMHTTTAQGLLMYKVGKPTRLRGISIPRTYPPVYIVTFNGKRVDAFLSQHNARACAGRLNDALFGDDNANIHSSKPVD